jgi:hypothetical protein
MLYSEIKLVQNNMDKKHRHSTLPSCLTIIIVTSCLHGCSQSVSSTTTSSLATGSSSDSVADKKLSKSPSVDGDPDSSQVSGSKVPSKWFYSQDKTVACRIKQWSSYPSETYVDFEFTNLKSEKPVNIVYTVAPRTKSGEFIHFFNEFTNNQTSLTEFNPPLKKGETKIENYVRKFVLPSLSVELKGCRVAKKNENFWTVNPEMRNYVGP